MYYRRRHRSSAKMNGMRAGPTRRISTRCTNSTSPCSRKRMRERKVVVVTGASSGIGRAVTLEAAAKGYAVIAVSREGADLQSVAAEVQNDGGTCVPIVLDVTAPD